nr:hypothetical protein CFP56_10207 [Quercus suber]
MSSSDQGPAGNPVNDDYVSRPGQKDTVPVQSDETPVNDPIDAETANSDKQLEADEAQAIDKSNIMDERTRGAAPSDDTYTEPGDREGLPENDGRSRIAQQ